MAKQLTIQEQIDFIWKSNPKIPFMQSKEILILGYTKGFESANINSSSINIKSEKSISEVKKTEMNTDFIGNTKELIKHTDEQINKHNKVDKKLIEVETSYNIYNELLKYITDSRDLTDIYSYIKGLKLSTKKQLDKLKS